MRKVKKASWKWRLMLALAGMTASTVWGQGIIYVSPPSLIATSPFGGVPRTVNIDINGDGVPDLTFQADGGAYAWMIPQNGSFIAITGDGTVANIAVGDMVGSGMLYGWTASQSILSSVFTVFDVGGGTLSEGGNFVGQTYGYIGFDVVVDGNNYYGWMQLYDSYNDLATGGVITGWAYSTVPNVPIMVGQVPEPGTLGLLGLGGLVLFATRRQWQR